MEIEIDINSIYRLSDNLISKNIEDELVIVPLESGMGDLNAELFSLNKSGVVIWNKLDGTQPVKTIIKEIAKDYGIPYDEIETEIVDLIKKLLQKGLIVKV